LELLNKPTVHTLSVDFQRVAITTGTIITEIGTKSSPDSVLMNNEPTPMGNANSGEAAAGLAPGIQEIRSADQTFPDTNCIIPDEIIAPSQQADGKNAI